MKLTIDASGFGQALKAIGTAAHYVRIMVVLAVIFPVALFTEPKVATHKQRRKKAAWARGSRTMVKP